jgi:hypothetical protein
MREIRSYGSVGVPAGNRRHYPADPLAPCGPLLDARRVNPPFLGPFAAPAALDGTGLFRVYEVPCSRGVVETMFVGMASKRDGEPPLGLAWISGSRR